MKKTQRWRMCLLIFAMAVLMVSCQLPFNIGKETAETTASSAEASTPVSSGDAAEPNDGTFAPAETSSDIRPGQDEDYTWESYQPFA